MLIVSMVTDSDILSVNATLITGVLVFLTIAPFSANLMAQISGRLGVLLSVYGTISILMASTAVIFFSWDSPDLIVFIAKILTFGGVVGILSTILFVWRGPSRVQRMQKV